MRASAFTSVDRARRGCPPTGNLQPACLLPQRPEKKQRLAPARASTSFTNPRAMREQIAQMRSRMEEDDQMKTLMAGLRGKNIDDSDFADESVVMRLVNVDTDDPDDELPLTYSPELIEDYWSRRPVAVTSRIFQLLGISWSFLSKLAIDTVRGVVSDNEVARARELREIVTSLGPAYIKLGQALSIRPDILSPAAMNELQKLCDKVPSFDDDTAMQVIQDELGAPWYEVYAELSPKPIAAASLGQVYKGMLKSGEEVAVKVQRPYVLETVTVDLFIIRKIGLFLRRFPQIGTDVVALLDEWAIHFFEELDYVHEGNNGTLFAESIVKDLPQIVVPKTFDQLTSRRVLTTSWLEGEKLSQSQAGDIKQLVNLGVVCYLKQLLDTGFFHGDPHPGNMMRTPDGRLAILDFGLMTQVDSNIKYGMIEAISHLIHRDYEAIVEDFVTLDFIPQGTDLRPILPVLAKVFDQALAGGGAKSINFQELAADLAQITFDYPFRIPPYFALIIRAISVLEGVALVGNPEFAIVDEAYPYIAKRLLTDESPRLQAALKYMIYGKDDVFDVERLIDLLSAFESFREASQSARGNMDNAEFALPTSRSALPAESSASGSTAITPFDWLMGGGNVPAPAFGLLPNGGALTPFPLPFPLGNVSLFPNFSRGKPGLAQEGVARYSPGSASQPSSSGGESVGREALKFVLSPEGSFFRDFLMNETVQSIDALSRKQLLGLANRVGLRNARLPLLLPGAAVPALPLAPELTQRDEKQVDNILQLVSFLTGGGSPAGAFRGLSPTVAREVVPLLPAFALSFVPELMQRLASRVVARFLREGFLLEGK